MPGGRSGVRRGRGRDRSADEGGGGEFSMGAGRDEKVVFRADPSYLCMRWILKRALKRLSAWARPMVYGAFVFGDEKDLFRVSYSCGFGASSFNRVVCLFVLVRCQKILSRVKAEELA